MTTTLTKPAKLLIVEDQPFNIKVLCEIFNHEYELFMATSGEKALQVCAETLPDLILMDIMMPGMDGHEACRQLKANSKTAEIPVIFVTAQSSPQEEAHALDVGGVDFISKPFNAPVVRARVRAHLALKRQSDFLRSLAFVDGLTGLANRRHFDESLVVEWRDCKRNGYPLSIVLMDIDHFKKYNDHYGHQQGDACLRSVGSLIRGSMGRAHDLAARYGGEEFVCILPNCDLPDAIQLAEKIRKTILATEMPHANSATAPIVTISQGVSCVVPNELASSDQLVELADKQLYSAKMAGRNRVIGARLDGSVVHS